VVQLLDPTLVIKLDLSGNNIRDIIIEGNISNYNQIEHLNLSHNQLVRMEHSSLPSNLSFLSLQNNKIRVLTKDNIEFIQDLINQNNFHMNLGGNPYECNCLSEEFHNFLVSPGGARVLDHNLVWLDCSRGPMQLVKADEEDFCYTLAQTILVPVVAIFTTFAAIICLTLAIYFGNRQRLLVYLYSKKWSRRFFHEEHIDQDKHYDAFISYSHADTEYVETLLRGLEQSPDPEFRYKVHSYTFLPSETKVDICIGIGCCLTRVQVCVHSRDWNVGEGIPSQIFRSVADSRKTIIVLSQVIDYLCFGLDVLSQSYNTPQELRGEQVVGHGVHGGAQEGSPGQDPGLPNIAWAECSLRLQRVIVIKHGELVAEAEIEEDLQNYLKMNTYLESSDPWFWPKLR
jgi:protein toll